MQWHPLFAELLRPLIENYYEVQTNVPVGDAPRAADLVLVRRTSPSEPPFEGLWRWLTAWNIVEFKGHGGRRSAPGVGGSPGRAGRLTVLEPPKLVCPALGYGEASAAQFVGAHRRKSLSDNETSCQAGPGLGAWSPPGAERVQPCNEMRGPRVRYLIIVNFGTLDKGGRGAHLPCARAALRTLGRFGDFGVTRPDF
jgi:hypothetical protein